MSIRPFETGNSMRTFFCHDQTSTFSFEITRYIFHLLGENSLRGNAPSVNFFPVTPVVQYEQTEILGWYYRCPNGFRVVGCCSRIASMIWYLSFARYRLEALREPASSYLNSLTDAQNYSDISDDGEDESDDENSQTLYTLA